MSYASPQAGVILIDPPWAYQNMRESVNGAASSHYVTMTDEDILDLPLASLASDDCVLACWATWPRLDLALACIGNWGWRYVTAIPWVKYVPCAKEKPAIRRGVGFWSMAASEVLLLAARGAPKRQGDRSDTPIGLLTGDDRVFWAPRSKHSRKPNEVHDWLERRHVGPYLELFARRPRDGWTCWGGDLGYRIDRKGVHDVREPWRLHEEMVNEGDV